MNTKQEQSMSLKASLNVSNNEISDLATLKAIKEFHEGKNISKTFDSVEDLMKDLDT